MAIRNVELMQERFREHLRMGTARIKNNYMYDFFNFRCQISSLNILIKMNLFSEEIWHRKLKKSYK